jgi:hypothetical protein
MLFSLSSVSYAFDARVMMDEDVKRVLEQREVKAAVSQTNPQNDKIRVIYHYNCEKADDLTEEEKSLKVVPCEENYPSKLRETEE